jgi:hypothetical protein
MVSLVGLLLRVFLEAPVALTPVPDGFAQDLIAGANGFEDRNDSTRRQEDCGDVAEYSTGIGSLFNSDFSPGDVGYAVKADVMAIGQNCEIRALFQDLPICRAGFIADIVKRLGDAEAIGGITPMANAGTGMKKEAFRFQYFIPVPVDVQLNDVDLRLPSGVADNHIFSQHLEFFLKISLFHSARAELFVDGFKCGRRFCGNSFRQSFECHFGGQTRLQGAYPFAEVIVATRPVTYPGKVARADFRDNQTILHGQDFDSTFPADGSKAFRTCCCAGVRCDDNSLWTNYSDNGCGNADATPCQKSNQGWMVTTEWHSGAVILRRTQQFSNVPNVIVVAHFAKPSTTKGAKVHEGKAEEQRTSWYLGPFMVQGFRGRVVKLTHYHVIGYLA